MHWSHQGSDQACTHLEGQGRRRWRCLLHCGQDPRVYGLLHLGGEQVEDRRGGSSDWHGIKLTGSRFGAAMRIPVRRRYEGRRFIERG